MGFWEWLIGKYGYKKTFVSHTEWLHSRDNVLKQYKFEGEDRNFEIRIGFKAGRNLYGSERMFFFLVSPNILNGSDEVEFQMRSGENVVSRQEDMLYDDKEDRSIISFGDSISMSKLVTMFSNNMPVNVSIKYKGDFLMHLDLPNPEGFAGALAAMDAYAFGEPRFK